MMQEEEDEETVFDQEGLLGSGKKSSWDWEWVQRITKTVSLSLAFFALGLCISIPGATLLDLEERTHSSTERISLIFTARSLGYLLGSILGGVLFDYFDQQILLFYTLVLTGIATIAVPWCTVLLTLACMIAVQGLALGVLDTGGNMFCIKVWSKSSAPYMQALHFSFAVGAFLAPLLARPFLIGEGALGANSTTFPVSHIPVNTKIPHLSGGETSGGQDNLHRLTRSMDAWWLADGRLDRAARDVRGDTDTASVNATGVGGVNATMNVMNKTGSTLPSNVSVTSTPAPRATKPIAISNKHLTSEYANSDKAKSPLMEHKNDKRPQGDDQKDTTPVNTLLTSNKTVSVTGNDTNSNTSDSAHKGNVSGSVGNDTSSGNETNSRDKSGVSPSPSSVPLPSPPPLPATLAPSTLPTAAPTTTSTSTTTTTTTTTTTVPTTTTTSAPSPTTTTSTTTTTTGKLSTIPDKLDAQTTTNNASSNATISTMLPTTTTVRKPGTQIFDVITSTINAVKNMSKIQFAYMIIGLILMGDALLFLGLYCKDCRAGTLLHQIAALGPSPPPTPQCFRVSILSLLFVFFLFYVGIEVAFGGLVTTFAVESDFINWNRQQGATLAALFWGSIAAGRGMAIFIARCFKPPCMLVSDLVIMLAGALILSFSLKESAVMLWVGTVTLGFGMSSVFPTAVSWADCYYPLTGRAAAVFITGSGIGEMVIPVMTGYLFEKFDRMWLMYIVLGLSGIVTIVFICLQCIASRQPPPTSISKFGFLPLNNEDENDIAMEDMVNGNTGYTESSRRRQLPNNSYNHVEDAEEETTKLVDISE